MNERFLGINIEYPKTNRMAVVMLVGLSKITALGFTVEGKIPSNGPAILVANHTRTSDFFRTEFATFTTSGRIFRPIAKETILDPSIKEPEEVLERTGKKGKLDPMKFPLIAQSLAFLFGGIGAFPAQRGSVGRSNTKDMKLFRASHASLTAGELVGLFIQETRVESGDLRNPFPGAGLIARMNPDVPIVAATILNRALGNKIIIESSNHPTYNGLVQAAGHKLSPHEVVAAIGDIIASHHVPAVRRKWEQEDRPQFLAKAA